MMIDVLCAVVLDLIIGDPPNFPHPIKLMGHLIAFEEKLVRQYVQRLTSHQDGHHSDCRLSIVDCRLSTPDHQSSIINHQSSIGKSGAHLLLAGGFLLVVINLCLAFFIPYFLLQLLKPYPYIYHPIHIYLLYTCLAARCLRDEALNVYKALAQGIEKARYTLSCIVGRETKHLDEPEIIRATVETVAENTADGIIAPLCYGMVGGAPLALAYKMVNTMDSMLGYMTKKYREIGFFPAKIDDVLNYIPARITGVLMNISGLFPSWEGVGVGKGEISRFHVSNGFKMMFRDRHNHKSPNCAYPEGAMAGLLGIQLGGDNVYFGKIVKKPTIGDRTRLLDKKDIKRAIDVMFRTELMLLLVYILIVLF